MPLYDYRCQKCGGTFEVIQKFADEPLTVHEGCGGQVDRLVSAPSFQFKGTGWYVTDYGKNGKVPAKPSNGASESKKETSDAKPKTETKPATPAKSE